MSTAFYNIFSTEKSKTKKEKPKEKLIVDYREKNSLVASELINLGFEIEFKELKVADYIVKGVAIERKTISDFISSMINKGWLINLKKFLLQKAPSSSLPMSFLIRFQPTAHSAKKMFCTKSASRFKKTS